MDFSPSLERILDPFITSVSFIVQILTVFIKPEMSKVKHEVVIVFGKAFFSWLINIPFTPTMPCLDSPHFSFNLNNCVFINVVDSIFIIVSFVSILIVRFRSQ